MSEIEIIPPVTQERWGTSNTKVAACCVAYGFRQCVEQPYVRHANFSRPDKIFTSYWLEPNHSRSTWRDPDSPLLEERAVTCQDFEVAWRHWPELVERRGRYVDPPEWRLPLIYLRTGLDWRHWALENLITPAEREKDVPRLIAPGEKPKEFILLNTDQWVCEKTGQKEFRPYKVVADSNGFYFAVCLIAHGCGIKSFRRGEFIFNALDAEPLWKDYIDTGKQCRMQWHKVGMVRYDLLWEDARKQTRKEGPDNVPILWIRHGKDVGLLPQNFTLKNKEALIKMLVAGV